MSVVNNRGLSPLATTGTKTSEYAGAVIDRATKAVLSKVYASSAYGLTLRGPLPDQIAFYPEDLQTGSLEKAKALFAGHYWLPGGQVNTPGTPPWSAIPPSDMWATELHGFTWLRHLSAQGDESARAHARQLIASWISECGKRSGLAWSPQVIGRRLISWISNAPLILASADLIYRSAVLANMGHQARLLARSARHAPPGLPRLTAALGLSFSGLCLSEGETRLKRGLEMVCSELDRQILPDGGHISRNPSDHLAILLDLISLTRTLMAQERDVPKAIREAIDRMTPMLRFFRHADGRLAIFNGSSEEDGALISRVLDQDDTRGRPFGHAPHSGFQRVATKSAVLIMDTGTPPPGPYTVNAHAGCLSFELSSGENRIIVNCGATKERGTEWQKAGRATAAHSTLIVDDTSSARLLLGRPSGRILGPRVIYGPRKVKNTRKESEQGIWLDTVHDGYLERLGILHRRRIYIDAEGTDVRGEDRLIRHAQKRWRKPRPFPFAIRFHLHPDVKVSLAQDHASALIRLADGNGWRLRANNGVLSIEESVYLGTGDGIVRRSEQVVINGILDSDQAHTNWALKEIPNAPKGSENSEEPTQSDKLLS